MTRLSRLWAGTNSEIAINAGSLVGTTAVTAGLGFLYWLVAARQFSPGAVGLASASISAMTLLAYVGMLGLGTMLIGELPNQRGRESSLITAALLVSAFAGAVLGVLFALVAPLVAKDFQALQVSAVTIAVFAAGVALASAVMVADQALIGLLRGGVQFGRNAVFAVVKLLALGAVGLWLSERTGVTIYVTWVIGNVLSIAAVFVLGSVRGWYDLTARPRWSALHGLRRAALGHHGLNLTLQLPVLGLPIVVTAVLTAAFNAYFYVAWMVAVSFLWVVPSALSIVLYAVASKTPAALGRAIRFTIGISLVTGLIANFALPLIGDPILRLFGPSYVTYAGPSLRILALAVFPLIVKDLFVSISRLDRRLARATALVAVGGILELAAGAAGAHFGGLVGLSLGWTGVICLEALIMAPLVYRSAFEGSRHRRPSFLRPAQVDSER